MRILWNILLFSTIILAQDSTQSIYRAYTPHYFLKFGHYLFENRDYARAATELERFLFIQPVDTFPRVHFRVALAYFRLEAYPQAQLHFQSALTLAPPVSPLADSLRLGLAAIALRTANSPQLSPPLPNLPQLGKDGIHLTYRLYHALAQLKQHHFQQAQVYLPQDTAQISSDVRYGFFRVHRLIKKGLHLPQKSPWKAALFSTLLPGSGKFYTRQAGDGIYSFLLVVGSSLLSYRGFRRGDPFQKFFFGGAALFFYTGNIYGSYLSAKMYNQRARERLNEEIQQEIRYWTRF